MCNANSVQLLRLRGYLATYELLFLPGYLVFCSALSLTPSPPPSLSERELRDDLAAARWRRRQPGVTVGCKPQAVKRTQDRLRCKRGASQEDTERVLGSELGATCSPSRPPHPPPPLSALCVWNHFQHF